MKGKGSPTNVVVVLFQICKITKLYRVQKNHIFEGGGEKKGTLHK